MQVSIIYHVNIANAVINTRLMLLLLLVTESDIKICIFKPA